MTTNTDSHLDRELLNNLRGQLELDPKQIAACAYAVWESCGSPPGQDQAHWFQAETQLLLNEAQDRGLLAAPKRTTGKSSSSPILIGKTEKASDSSRKTSRKRGARKASS